MGPEQVGMTVKVDKVQFGDVVERIDKSELDGFTPLPTISSIIFAVDQRRAKETQEAIKAIKGVRSVEPDQGTYIA